MSTIKYVLKINLGSESVTESSSPGEASRSTSAEMFTGEGSHSTSDKTSCNCKKECIYNCACRRSNLPCGNSKNSFPLNERTI